MSSKAHGSTADTPDDPEQRLLEYLEDELAQRDPLRTKSKYIAEALPMSASHIGGIIGQWRVAEDPPLEVSVWGGRAHSNLWVISR